jgi:alpha-beta hydrolase superfamily lysophospholipase
MVHSVSLTVDVTQEAAISTEAHTVVTVFLPDVSALPEVPVVCFAYPGGGYSRGYFSFDLPDSTFGGEAGWHAERGWIFVACDHLGVGDATVPEGNALTYENVARGNRATIEAVMARLEAGTLLDGYPPIRGVVKLGIGQSMGGCFTIVLQGQHHVFDGVGILGFSAIHTVIPSRPGAVPAPMPWLTRGSGADSVTVNQAALTDALNAPLTEGTVEHPFEWGFHYDDVSVDIVARDMAAVTEGPLPPWRSATIPPCAILMLAPGTVATEAAAIRVPVLLATGERDVVPDPHMEPKAYMSATDISVFICPRMAHMHNFAGTRETFWRRIHAWGNTVAALRS